MARRNIDAAARRTAMKKHRMVMTPVAREEATGMSKISKLKSEQILVNVPGWSGLMDAVRDGHREFLEVLRASGLLARYGVSASEVHGYEEIELHAITLAIPSAGKYEEMRTKSFLTYVSHWIDDFFESP